MNYRHDKSLTVSRYAIHLNYGNNLIGLGKCPFHPLNVSHAMALIENLVANEIFLPWEIAFIILYLAQEGEYRKSFIARADEPVWKVEGRDIWQARLETIDSMQGNQAPLVLL